jgi:hypothetical protein
MIYALNGTQAMAKRRVVPSPGTGAEHWGTEFFGPRYAREPLFEQICDDGLDRDGEIYSLRSMVVVDRDEAVLRDQGRSQGAGSGGDAVPDRISRAHRLLE